MLFLKEDKSSNQKEKKMQKFDYIKIKMSTQLKTPRKIKREAID